MLHKRSLAPASVYSGSVPSDGIPTVMPSLLDLDPVNSADPGLLILIAPRRDRSCLLYHLAFWIHTENTFPLWISIEHRRSFITPGMSRIDIPSAIEQLSCVWFSSFLPRDQTYTRIANKEYTGFLRWRREVSLLLWFDYGELFNVVFD